MDNVLKLSHTYTFTSHLCLSIDVNETFVFKIHKQICHITTAINLCAAAQTVSRSISRPASTYTEDKLLLRQRGSKEKNISLVRLTNQEQK